MPSCAQINEIRTVANTYFHLFSFPKFEGCPCFAYDFSSLRNFIDVTHGEWFVVRLDEMEKENAVSSFSVRIKMRCHNSSRYMSTWKMEIWLPHWCRWFDCANTQVHSTLWHRIECSAHSLNFMGLVIIDQTHLRLRLLYLDFARTDATPNHTKSQSHAVE